VVQKAVVKKIIFHSAVLVTIVNIFFRCQLQMEQIKCSNYGATMLELKNISQGVAQDLVLAFYFRMKEWMQQ
jgi:hypothetical protein